MLLKTDDSVLQNREHQNAVGIQVKTSSISGLVLSFDQDIGLKNRQRSVIPRRSRALKAFNPKWRFSIFRHRCLDSLLNNHEKPPTCLDMPTHDMVPNLVPFLVMVATALGRDEWQ